MIAAESMPYGHAFFAGSQLLMIEALSYKKVISDNS
jgi:hypothetical protein